MTGTAAGGHDTTAPVDQRWFRRSPKYRWSRCKGLLARRSTMVQPQRSEMSHETPGFWRTAASASWAATQRVIAEHGTTALVLLVADTGVEDRDLWRFVRDSTVHIGVPPTIVAGGRAPFEVFRDQRFPVLSPGDTCRNLVRMPRARRAIRRSPQAALADLTLVSVAIPMSTEPPRCIGYVDPWRERIDEHLGR